MGLDFFTKLIQNLTLRAISLLLAVFKIFSLTFFLDEKIKNENQPPVRCKV